MCNIKQVITASIMLFLVLYNACSHAMLGSKRARVNPDAEVIAEVSMMGSRITPELQIFSFSHETVRFLHALIYANHIKFTPAENIQPQEGVGLEKSFQSYASCVLGKSEVTFEALSSCAFAGESDVNVRKGLMVLLLLEYKKYAIASAEINTPAVVNAVQEVNAFEAQLNQMLVGTASAQQAFLQQFSSSYAGTSGAGSVVLPCPMHKDQWVNMQSKFRFFLRDDLLTEASAIVPACMNGANGWSSIDCANPYLRSAMKSHLQQLLINQGVGAGIVTDIIEKHVFGQDQIEQSGIRHISIHELHQALVHYLKDSYGDRAEFLASITFLQVLNNIWLSEQCSKDIRSEAKKGLSAFQERAGFQSQDAHLIYRLTGWCIESAPESVLAESSPSATTITVVSNDDKRKIKEWACLMTGANNNGHQVLKRYLATFCKQVRELRDDAESVLSQLRSQLISRCCISSEDDWDNLTCNEKARDVFRKTMERVDYCSDDLCNVLDVLRETPFTQEIEKNIRNYILNNGNPGKDLSVDISY